MATITEGVRAFLAAAPYAHIVTLDPDGTSHVSMAWAGLDGDDLVWASFVDQHKLNNLRRDPRITVSFEQRAPSDELLHPYLVIRGRATITEGGAPPVMDRLGETYIGGPFPNRDMPEGFVIRVEIDEIYGLGPWKSGEAD
jgi:PPOX class probable F420-dependent enzyme